MSERRASIWSRLYNGETNFEFVRKWRVWFLFSGALVLIGLGSLFTRGLNLGIDFEGGTSWEVRAPGVSVGEARDVMRSEGLAEARIQIVGSDTLRIQADIGEGEEVDARAEEVADTLSDLAGGREVSVNNVGPSWGEDVSRKAVRALIFFFIAISLYITLRFEWKMAVGALAAVVHDILITVSVYSVAGFEVTPATVVAFLTILGYSMYDTIVVFDKVEENTKGLASTGRMTYTDVVNLSMNEVLMRSLNTSLVAIMPIGSVLFVGAYAMGATALQEFGLALLIGLMTGAYSSIFIASPLLALLKEREPRYAAIRHRLEARGGGNVALTPAAAAAMATPSGRGVETGDGLLRPKAAGGAATTTAERPAPASTAWNAATGQPPRGRKKRRR